MKIDVFNHIIPERFFTRMVEIAPHFAGVQKRFKAIPAMVDLSERFKMMDLYEEYVQILSLATPPLEDYGPPVVSSELAKLANDSMAEIVGKYPNRFPGFIASLPMNDPDGILKEADRACNSLGAVGVQIFSNVLGKPLDRPETMPLFELMNQLDRPIWIHPARGANFPDFREETKSHYEIWFVFGWPYETSVAMAHLVFSGLFDRYPNIKIITHHMGGIVPYCKGRVGPGWDQLGVRTFDVDYSKILEKLKRRPLDYFHMFYADTALFGADGATACGLGFFGAEKILFATDSPFGPEKGTANIRWTLEVLDNLDITAEDRGNIYEGNARRILKLI